MDWVAVVAREAFKRKREKYIVSDWKTPSGRVHIGALRGVVIHDEVAKTMAKKTPTSFIYGFDDYDPMDSIPEYLDEAKFRKYFGRPLSEIPSPEPGYSSYGEYYADDFLRVIKQAGCQPKILWSSKMYKTGQFNKAIRLVLENEKKINDIWSAIAKSKREHLPIAMLCRACGSIFHTRSSAWDGKLVKYRCLNCQLNGADSPFDGGAKLPWRVEWAAKWWLLKSDVEGAGKDHNTKGGSRDVAAAIAKEIFKIQPPVNIVYEWFLVGGRKMSSSKGVGAFASDIIEQVPPRIVRFLMTATRPGRAIDFDPGGDTILRLFDEYDKTQNGYNIRFSKVVFLVQMPHVDIFKLARQEKNKTLTGQELAELRRRVGYGKKWLTRFASAEQKFELQKSLPRVEITNFQKQFLVQLAQKFNQEKSWNGEKLHSIIHDLKAQKQLAPTDAFEPLYKIFLNKTHGPQAGWFLAALDRKFVIDRLKGASQISE